MPSGRRGGSGSGTWGQLQASKIDPGAAGRALQLIDQRRNVVVLRNRLAEAHELRVVAREGAAGGLSGGDLRAKAGELRLRRRDLRAEFRRLVALRRDHEQPRADHRRQGADDRDHRAVASGHFDPAGVVFDPVLLTGTAATVAMPVGPAPGSGAKNTTRSNDGVLGPQP